MDSYNYDKNNAPIPSQAGYIAEYSVNGYDMGVGGLNAPSDIFQKDGRFWIADTGNNRIIATDRDFSDAEVHEEFTYPDGSRTALKSPSGVFVSDRIYIADSGNSRILIADFEGNVLNEIVKPDSVTYDSNKTFVPQKVLADEGGNVYVLLSSVTSGSAVFSADGDFKGFFGADRVRRTSDLLRDYLDDMLISDGKKSRRVRSVPDSISGFDIDGDFIFTCSQSSVRRVNPSGVDVLKLETAGDIKPIFDTSGYIIQSVDIADVDISGDGYINCLDRSSGRIFQYDSDGRLLFVSGGAGRQTGLFRQACALESADGRIYVLDSIKNSIMVFTETEFGRIVHQATDLCNDGYYAESLDLWLEVLKRDGSYCRASEGLASAYLQGGDYRKSMYYAELSHSQKIYDKAFQGYRREFMQSYGGLVFGGILLSAVLFRKLRKKKWKRKNGYGT